MISRASLLTCRSGDSNSLEESQKTAAATDPAKSTLPNKPVASYSMTANSAGLLSPTAASKHDQWITMTSPSQDEQVIRFV